MEPTVSGNGGMEIVVKETGEDQLPNTQKTAHDPVQWQVIFLHSMENIIATSA
jgi:hypothetical protein